MPAFPAPEVGGMSQLSLRQLYLQQCQLHALAKPNSGILAKLPDDPDGADELRTLDLSDNVIGRRGFTCLLPIIAAAPRLDTLRLGHNMLTNQSVEQLLLVLQSHPSLTALDLSGNHLTALAGKGLLQLAKRNRNVLCIETAGTLIRPMMSSCIAAQLRRNEELLRVPPPPPVTAPQQPNDPAPPSTSPPVQSNDPSPRPPSPPPPSSPPTPLDSSPPAPAESAAEGGLVAYSLGGEFQGEDDETTIKRQLLETCETPPQNRRRTRFQEQIPSRQQTSSQPPCDPEADPVGPPPAGRQRRKTVSAATVDPEVARQFEVPEIPKGEQQVYVLLCALVGDALFAHLDENSLSAIVGAMKLQSFHQGDFVYRKGDYCEEGDCLYIIFQGQCELVDEDRVLSRKIDGDIFGAAEIMVCKERGHSVRVTSNDMEAYSLDRQTFQYLMTSTSVRKREAHYDALQVGFLKNLTHEEKVHLADALQPCDFDAGDFLIRFGEEGQWFYIILEGTVEVLGRDASGGVINVCTFGPRDFVGELEFIHHHPCVADVVAATPVRAVRMGRWHFELCMGSALEIFERNASKDNPTYNYYNAVTNKAEIPPAEDPVPTFSFGVQIIEASDDEEEKEDDAGEEREDDDDEEEESTFKPALPARRFTVSTEVIKAEEALDFQHEVIPKSEEDAALLRSILQDTPLFSQLDDRELTIAIEAMSPQSFQAGDVIITQGEILEAEDTYFYVIAEGQCAIIIDGMEVLTKRERDFFGEMELLHTQLRQATVTCTSPTMRCWCLTRPTYRMIVMGTFQRKRQKYGAFLRNVRFLEGLASWEFTQLADALELAVHRKGDLLIEFGSQGNWFHIIMEGTVEVRGRDKNGAPIIVGEFGMGKCIGELEFIFRHKAVADVVATSDEVRSVRLNRKHFELCMGPIVDLLKENACYSSDYDYYQQLPAGAITYEEGAEEVSAIPEGSGYAAMGGFVFGGAGSDNEAEAEDAPDAEDIEEAAEPLQDIPSPPRTGRRQTVSNERLDEEKAKNFVHRRVSKSKEDTELLTQVLMKNFLFSHLDDRELTRAVEAMSPVTLKPGELLREQGSEASEEDQFVVVVEGTLELLRDNQPVSSIGVGETYGDVELMYGQPAVQMVRAAAAVKAWVLKRDCYRYLVSGMFANKRKLYGDFLAKVSFLKPLSKRELLQLADALEPHTCNAGDFLISFGQEPDWFYILLEGEVQVWGRDQEDNRIFVCDFSVGDCIGELEFLNNHHTVADVVAKTAVRAAKLNRTHFELCMGPAKDLLNRAREEDEKFTYYNMKRHDTFVKKS